MNPRNLFSLTYRQQQLYDVQPDLFTGDYWSMQTDEYELPPYINKSGFRFWYNTQNIGFAPHWHNSQEIIIPLEENYTVIIKDTTYHLEPGDILLIPPGEIHSLEAPQNGARFIFLFELNLFSQLTDFSSTRSFLNKPIHITSTICPDIYEKEISFIMQLADYYWGESSTKQLHIYGCLLEFYACFTDYLMNSDIPSSPDRTANPKNTLVNLNLVIDFMKTHYSEKITLDTVAQMSCLSKYYFARAFKQYTGYTYTEYLDLLRVKAAESLLKDSTIPISNIAITCGYFTVSSFNRSFLKRNGCTPTKFRQLHKENI